MNKTCFYKYIKRFFSLFIFSCLIFFNFSCGLDTYEIIEAPYDIVHKPEVNEPVDESLISPQQFQEKYFEFSTRDQDNQNLSQVKFLGTDIYYKIYDDFSKLYSERFNLNNLAKSENMSVNLIYTLESSSGYGYKKLKSSNYNGNVLIPASSSGQNQKVKIRLTDYDTNYKSSILVDGNFINNNTKETLPLRNIESGNERTFNFGRKGDFDKIPVSEDKDCYINSTSSKVFYVNLYAVSVAIDTTFSLQYSNIFNIGSVIIDSSVENN